MEELSIEQIKQLCNSPRGLTLKNRVRQYVQSEQGYSKHRKRPRNKTEEKILAGFSRSRKMQILALYITQIDKTYMLEVGKGAETEEESEQIMKWFNEVEDLLDK